MKINKYAAALGVGLMCIAGQASAAQVAQVGALKGSVAVDQGGKIVQATSSTTLNPGDKLMAMNGASAQIKFADGCVVSVRSNAVATVGAQSPCAGSGAVNSAQPMQLGLGEFGGAAAVFAIGVVLVGAYALSVDDDGNGLSP